MTTTLLPGVRWYLDCEPRPVQLEAIARSYTGFAYREGKDDPIHRYELPHAGKPVTGFAYFMEMRLGKTPTFLNEFIAFYKDYGIHKALVFSPSKYKHAWGIEATKFGLPMFDMPVHVYQSSKYGRMDVKKFIRGGRGLLIVNYEALIYDNNRELLAEWVDDKTFVGADESVLIKNRESIFFTESHHLSKDAAATRVLTGKPVVQGPQDLYSQLRFARQFNGVNYHHFRNTYCVMGGYKGKKVVGVQNEERLQERLKRIAFTAHRRDWGTWFEPDQQEITVPIDDTQKKYYKEMEEDFIIWLNDSGDSVTAEQVITRHMKLQQISSGFIYDNERNVRWIIDFGESPKVKEILERMQNEIVSKVIIIAVHKPIIQALCDVLTKHQYQPAIIAGGRTDTESQKKRFNEDPKCRVMIGQEKATKYGHNLMGNPADPCDVMIYFENTYSLDDRAQTIERPQGEGQQGPITVLDYVGTPIEAKIIYALQHKNEISKVIMDYYHHDRSDW